MKWIQPCKRWKTASGQSLIETALLLPLILLFVFNAINFGYYFVVALHLASGPREGVQWAIQGGLTPVAGATLPPPGPPSSPLTVSYLTYGDLATLNGSSTSAINVCSISVAQEKNIPLNNPGTTTQSAPCESYGSAADPAFPAAADPDPESPLFVLQRVEVQYKVQPLIGAMNLKVGGLDFGLLTPGLTFHRQVSMRAIQ